ncbi:MAG: hypothetical protein J5940_03635 [Clostridia bacterium]|nr:hypothetical protein [Clostridia bacterium]
MEGFRRAIEYIKTALIALLIISAVCLFIAYMFEFQTISEDRAIAFDDMKVLSGNDTRAAYDLTSDCIFPAAFAYSCDGTQNLFTKSRSLYNTAYGEALDYLKVMYSSSSYCVKITDGAYDVWNYCMRRDFVYLLYQKPLPVSLLCLFSGNFDSGVDDAVQGELPYIREIFLLSGDAYLASAFSRASGKSVSPASGDICAAARDADGEIYLIFNVSSRSEAKFDKALFSAYNKNDSVCAFSFFRDVCADGRFAGMTGRFSDTVIIPEKVSAVQNVIAENCTASDFSDAVILKFLEDVGINTTKLRHYASADDEETYISENFIFRISNDGAVTYQATGDVGIPISAVLGYSTASGNYSLFDSLSAVEKFLSCAEKDLGSAFFGSNIFSRLVTDCVFENGVLTLKYGYGADGILLKGRPCASVTVENGSITSAEINTLKASTSGESRKPESADWILEYSAYSDTFEAERTLAGIRIVYAERDGVCKAEWEVSAR